MMSTEVAKKPLLEHFWDLVSSKAEARLAAAQGLLLSLAESEKQGTLERDLEYTLKRLVRGLASNRPTARQGFALALTELLSIATNVEVSSVVRLIAEQMQIEGSMTREEQRSTYFGRLFGYESLIKSGRLQAIGATSGNASAVGEMVQDTLALMNKKAYLPALAGRVLTEIVTAVPRDLYLGQIAPRITPLLAGSPSEASPESLALALALRRSLGDVQELKTWPAGHIMLKRPSQFARTLKDTTSVHPQVHFVWDYILDDFIAALSETPAEALSALGEFWQAVVDEALMTSSHDRKHLGMELLKRVLPRLPVEAVPLVFTRNLVRSLITHLADHKNNLHGQAKDVCRALIAAAEHNGRVAVALTAQLTGPHGSAQFDTLTKSRTVAALLARFDARGVADYAASLMSTFLRPELSREHDDEADSADRQAEKRRAWALEQLLVLFRAARVPHTQDFVHRLLRFLCVHAFFSVTKADPRSPFEELRVAPSPPITAASHTACAQRLFAILGDPAALQALSSASDHASAAAAAAPTATATPAKKGAKKSATAAAESAPVIPGNDWAGYVLQEQKRIARCAGVARLTELPADVSQAIDAALQTIATCHQLAAGAADRLQRARLTGFAALLGNVGLLALAEPEETLSALKDLEEVFNRFAKPKPAPGTAVARRHGPAAAAAAAAAATAADSSAPRDSEDPMVVLTDVLLALLSRPSHSMRTVVSAAFRSFAPLLTPGALQLLVQTVRGQEEEDGTGSDAAASAEEEEDSATDEDDTGSSGEDAESDSEAESKEDSDEDEEEEDDDDEAAGPPSDVLARIRAAALAHAPPSLQRKLRAQEEARARKAAGKAPSEPSSDEDADDASESAETEESGSEAGSGSGDEADAGDDIDLDTVDDAELLKIDEGLARMFSEMRRSRTEAKDTARQQQHFRLRVLDLIETFVRSQAENPLVLELVLPLLAAASDVSGSVSDRALFDRITGIYRNRLCHSKEYPRDPSLDAVRLNKMIDALFEKHVQHAPSTPVAMLASAGILYLAKVLQRMPAAASVSRQPALKKEKESGRKRKAAEVTPAPTYGALDAEALIDRYGSAYERYTHAYHAHLSAKFFAEFIDRLPDLALRFAPFLLKGARDGRSPFLRTESFELLTRLFSGPTLLTAPDKQVTALGHELSTTLATVVPQLKEGKAARLRTALRAMAVFLTRQAKRSSPLSAASVVNSAALESALRPLVDAGAVSSPVVRSEAVRILRLIGIEVASAPAAAGPVAGGTGKRQHDDGDSGDEDLMPSKSAGPSKKAAKAAKAHKREKSDQRDKSGLHGKDQLRRDKPAEAAGHAPGKSRDHDGARGHEKSGTVGRVARAGDAATAVPSQPSKKHAPAPAPAAAAAAAGVPREHVSGKKRKEGPAKGEPDAAGAPSAVKSSKPGKGHGGGKRVHRDTGSGNPPSHAT